MSRTELILGPPGTGKTTALLDNVSEALAAGTDPSRIGYMAFTRKAAREAAGRAAERFNIRQDDLPWFRTLHSAAFHILGLRPDEVMQDSHFKELGEALGSFTFQHSYDETVERAPLGGGLGDRALAVYSRARARMISVEEEWAKGEDEISLADAKRFARTLEAYKESYQLRDFNDFLDEVHEPLPFELFIIDEAQDLTRQQWAFARRVGATAKRVIIAGDDDQAIFQWSGADLSLFLAFAGNTKVLPLSHRLPRLIWAKAYALAESIKYRRPKAWGPRDDDGQIVWLDIPEQVAVDNGQTWLLLARHKWQLGDLERICRDKGVVYQRDGQWSNQTTAVRAVVNYERLRRGEALGNAQVQAIARFVPGMTPPPKSVPSFSWGDLAWPFAGQPDWMAALSGIGADEREYIRKLRRSGESLVNSGRVVISTIHGIKGGEADCVLIIPDVSRKVCDRLAVDEEKRVWYVAISRAIKELHICAPATERFFRA